jgi:6,7-dimethyl-8-ribityllumazine synthase
MPKPTVTVRMEENGQGATVRVPRGRFSFVRPDSCCRSTMEKPVNQSSENHPKKLHLAFLQARWHADIVDECRKAFVAEISLRTNGSAIIDVFDVPGAFELPLLAKKLAKTGRYNAIVGSALVVNGGIYRHDFVADAVVAGLMQAQMETEVPILSAVLTPHNFHDSDEHRRFFLDHFAIKGREVAAACLSIVKLNADFALAA